MDHQRHAERFETTAGQFRTMGTGRRRQTAAVNVGEVDATLFDQRTVFDDPGPATAACRTRPGILDEARAAVLGLKGGADTVLQIEQVGFDGFGTLVHEFTLASGLRCRRAWAQSGSARTEGRQAYHRAN